MFKMSAIGRAGMSRGVEEQYGNMEKFVGTLFPFFQKIWEMI